MTTQPNHTIEYQVLSEVKSVGFIRVDSSLCDQDGKLSAIRLLDQANYLKVSEIDRSVVKYKITTEGCHRLNHLNQISCNTPKQKTPYEVTDKNAELFAILSKRFNILKSADKRGLDFNLTDANVRKLLNQKVCYYTGVEFDSDDDPLNVKTFERIDDSKGYVHGNVVAVTLRANRIKNMLIEHDNSEYNIGIEQFLNMADKLKKHLGN